MQYPDVPISQEKWNLLFKDRVTGNISPMQKYIDIQNVKNKKKHYNQKKGGKAKKEN